MRHAEVIAKPVAVNPKRGIRGIKVQHFRQFTRYDVFAGDLVELRGIRNRLKPLRDVFDRDVGVAKEMFRARFCEIDGGEPLSAPSLLNAG